MTMTQGSMWSCQGCERKVTFYNNVNHQMIPTNKTTLGSIAINTCYSSAEPPMHCNVSLSPENWDAPRECDKWIGFRVALLCWVGGQGQWNQTWINRTFKKILVQSKIIKCNQAHNTYNLLISNISLIKRMTSLVTLVFLWISHTMWLSYAQCELYIRVF